MSPTDTHDIVEQATEAVRGGAVPAPPDGLAAATLATTHQALAAEAVERSHRNRRRIMRVTGIGGLVAATVVAATLLGTGHRADATELLKAALDNQAKVTTWQAVVTTKFTGERPPGVPETFVAKISWDGARMRQESDANTIISDGKRVVLLDPKAKTASFMPMTDQARRDDVKQMTDGIRKVIDSTQGKGKVTPVVAAVIGGKERPGFKVEGVDLMVGPTAVTYWLDEERKLILRMEMSIAGPPAMTATSDYTYNPDLDPKLFDMTVPDGYAERKLELPPMPPAPVPPVAPLKVAPPVAPPKKVEPEFLPPPKE
jgi:outer membrane lipoprotein-sorting protein